MIHNIFSVRDTCVESFLLPMFFQNSAAAVRALGDAVNKSGSDNQFFQHPEHYHLYHLGVFDDDNGSMNLLDAPVFVVDCQSLVRS